MFKCAIKGPSGWGPDPACPVQMSKISNASNYLKLTLDTGLSTWYTLNILPPPRKKRKLNDLFFKNNKNVWVYGPG